VFNYSSASASATEKTTLQYFIIRTEFLKLASCINYTSFLGRCIHYGDVANLKNVYQCDSFSNWICSHLHKFYDSVNYKSLEKVKDKNFCKTKSKRLYSSNENKLDIWLRNYHFAGFGNIAHWVDEVYMMAFRGMLVQWVMCKESLNTVGRIYCYLQKKRSIFGAY
jgi:hypothetical protein